MIYFYDDIDATNSIRISNDEIAELDLVAKIKESDLDKYLKKYLKKDVEIWIYYEMPNLAKDYNCQFVISDEFGLWYTNGNKKHTDIWKESKKSATKLIVEEYDPTDDIINKGNSVGMDYETFLKFAEKQDYKFNVTDATFYFGINSNIKIEGRECSCIPSEDGILIIDNHSSIEIPRKDIDIVEGVSLSKNVLRMDICTKDGDVLTVWWEL